MKLSIILFAIFMTCASVLPGRKCKCEIEQKYYLKQRLVHIENAPLGFSETIKEGSIYVGRKLVYTDSLDVSPVGY